MLVTVNPAMVKDSNTYTVSIKNVDSLEKSLASIGLVK